MSCFNKSAVLTKSLYTVDFFFITDLIKKYNKVSGGYIMDSREAAMHIERLIKFALKKGLIEELDVIPSRNALMDLFKIEVPYEGEVPEEELDSPSSILTKLLDYAVEIGLIENTITYRDLMDARIMGLLMPRESHPTPPGWAITAASWSKPWPPFTPNTATTSVLPRRAIRLCTPPCSNARV